METTTSKEIRKRPSDWHIDLHVVTGEVKRAKFHGTERQVKAHLKMLNASGVGGVWKLGWEHG